MLVFVFIDDDSINLKLKAFKCLSVRISEATMYHKITIEHPLPSIQPYWEIRSAVMSLKSQVIDCITSAIKSTSVICIESVPIYRLRVDCIHSAVETQVLVALVQFVSI